MRSRYIAELVVALAPACCVAQAWTDPILVGDGKTTQIFVYPSSIRKVAPDIVQAWTLHRYATPRPTADGQLAFGLKSLTRYNCAEGSEKDLQIVIYGDVELSVVLISGSFSGDDRSHYAVPGTVGETALAAICAAAAHQK